MPFRSRRAHSQRSGATSGSDAAFAHNGAIPRARGLAHTERANHQGGELLKQSQEKQQQMTSTMRAYIVLAVADSRLADLQRAAIHTTTNQPRRRARHPAHDHRAVSVKTMFWRRAAAMSVVALAAVVA